MGWPKTAGRGSDLAGIERRGIRMKEITGVDHMSVRGEREGTEDGRRNPKNKPHSAEYTKGARGPDRPRREVAACRVMGQRELTGLAGSDPKRNSKEKIISNFNDFWNLARL
jgi:hypothetical protein